MWPIIQRAVRYSHAAYVDLRLFLTGKTDPELPPLRLRDVGLGDFRAIGRHLLDLTVAYGSARPESRLLDIGCGTGRLALPLTRFLTAGQYEGFDVSTAAIRWCRRNIASRYPNFGFTHVALRNSEYSFRGPSAARFVFPYQDSLFDCVVAYSLFTHLAFDEARNYLRQTYRVLSPGGRFVGTYFLLNRESDSAQRAQSSVPQFPHENRPLRFASQSNPAWAVAIEQEVLVEVLGETGFRDVLIKPGSWYGLQGTPTFQDLVVCTK